jgi:hypothetical protein
MEGRPFFRTRLKSIYKSFQIGTLKSFDRGKFSHTDSGESHAMNQFMARYNQERASEEALVRLRLGIK